MADLSHGSRPPTSWAYNSRIGLILFFLYFAIYAAFIYLSAFSRDTMKADSIGGVNLAIVFGFGLIFGAFFLAVVYMLLCKPEVDSRPELTEIEVANKAAEEEGQA